MDSSVSPKDEIRFLRVCHRILTGRHKRVLLGIRWDCPNNLTQSLTSELNKVKWAASRPPSASSAEVNTECEAWGLLGTRTGLNAIATRKFYFNGRPHIVLLILNIKWCYSVQTQQWHTIISTLVWLQVSAFSRPSSGQYYPIEGKHVVCYRIWDPILFMGCA